jgi:hypothetical protein
MRRMLMVSLHYSVFPPLYAHLFLCLNSWFRSPRRPLWSTPQDGGVHACLLPEVLGPRTLADAMRIAPRGSAGWRLRPRKLERQPLSFCLYATAAREAPLSPHQRQQKKRSHTHTPVALGNGRLRLQQTAFTFVYKYQCPRHRVSESRVE